MRAIISVRNAAVVTFLFILLCSGAGALEAQEAYLAGPEELNAAVLDHESSEQAARAQLDSFLADPQVQAVATENGIDLDRIERSLHTLNADEVERLAEASEAVRQSRTTITISASTILLILLLILILG